MKWFKRIFCNKRISENRKIKKVFISYWTEEEILAIRLKEMLENLNKSDADFECWCSARREDLMPGDVWKEEIEKNAVGSDCGIIVISPASIKRPWIHFESGLIRGSKKTNTIIPLLIGGARVKDLPSTISDRMALDANDKESFNLTFKSRFNGDGVSTFDAFQNDIEVKRISEYGHLSRLIPGEVTEQKFGPFVFEQDLQNETYQRIENSKQISSIRVTFIPRKIAEVLNWKLGIKICGGHKDFVIHAGCHKGCTTLTLYHSQSDANYKFEFPAKLDVDNEIAIDVWFDKDRQNIEINIVDSNGKHRILQNDSDGFLWNLPVVDWTNIRVEGWNDKKDHLQDNNWRYRCSVKSIIVERQ